MTQCPLLIVHVKILQLEDPIFESPISPPYYRPSIALPGNTTYIHKLDQSPFMWLLWRLLVMPRIAAPGMASR